MDDEEYRRLEGLPSPDEEAAQAARGDEARARNERSLRLAQEEKVELPLGEDSWAMTSHADLATVWFARRHLKRVRRHLEAQGFRVTVDKARVDMQFDFRLDARRGPERGGGGAFVREPRHPIQPTGRPRPQLSADRLKPASETMPRRWTAKPYGESVKVPSSRARQVWILVAVLVSVTAIVVAIMADGTGGGYGGIAFVSGWLIVMVLTVASGVVDVRHGGPFGAGANPAANAETARVEVRGIVTLRNPLGRGGPIPFGRLAFDEHLLGIRGPGADFIVKRGDVRYLRVRDTTFGTRVTVVLLDGSEAKTEFATRKRQQLVEGLREHDWPLQLEH